MLKLILVLLLVSSIFSNHLFLKSENELNYTVKDIVHLFGSARNFETKFFKILDDKKSLFYNYSDLSTYDLFM